MGRREKHSLKIAYEPRSILDVLKKMKNISSLMMDLSYYSFLYNNKEIAEKVLELEDEVDRLNYLLIMNGTLAVRDREDAEAIAGLIQIGNALELISNASADVSKIVLDDLAPTDLVKKAFKEAEEVVASLVVREDSELVGKNLEYIENMDVFIDVIAMKKKSGEVILDPDSNAKIEAGDTLIVRGIEEMVDKLFKMNGQKGFTYSLPYKEPSGKKIVGEDILIDRIIEMKDKVELMLDLAYSAVMLNDKTIAEQVVQLENYFDWLHDDFEFLVLSLIGEDVDKSNIIALLRLGISAENMADGAYKIAEIVIRGLQPHPILKRVIDESEEFLTVYKVKSSSLLVGKTIGELEDKFGIQVVALDRKGHYFFDVDEDFEVKDGDILIIRGFKEAKEDLYNTFNNP